MKRILLFNLIFLSGFVSAQFFSSPPTLDGTADANYVTDGPWSLGWDDQYLYINYTGGSALEPVIVYLDVDPIEPVSGGANSDGSLVGQDNWGITPTLPFRADFMIYWESQYAEYRTATGGGWSSNTSVGTSDRSNNASTNREIRLAWTSMGLPGRPSSFNWLGYSNSRVTPGFIFDERPLDLPEGAIAAPRFYYYFSVSSTDDNVNITSPFNQLSYEFRDGADEFISSAKSFYDLTINRNSTDFNLVLDNNTTAFTVEVSNKTYLSGGIDVIDNATLSFLSGASVIIAPNGFLDAQNNGVITYANTGTSLTYESGGQYNTGDEWPLNNPPSNILVDQSGTILDINDERILNGDLTVETGTTLDINTNVGVLELAGSITNNGTINVNNEASLVQTSSGADNNSGSGTYNVTREITAVNHLRFNFWSSPVSDAQIEDEFSSSLASDRYWYDASVTTNNGYVNQQTGTMVVGRGYAITPTTQTPQTNTNFTDTRVFEADLGNNEDINNGPLSYQISSVDQGDFIMIGNPYPSAIDFAELYSDNNTMIEGSAYFWDASPASSPSGYAVYNQTGSNGSIANSTKNTVDQFIPAMQGFMVQALSTIGSNQTLNFSFQNDQRVSGNNASTSFFKQETRERFWLNLKSPSARNSILIGLLDNASNGHDPKYDGSILKSNQYQEFYSENNGRQYAIQALPKFSQSNSSRVIPLGVDAWETGQYTIALDSLNNWKAGHNIYLVDSFNNVQVDLAQTDYRFTVNNSGSIQNRFYLMIDNASVGLSELRSESVVWGYAQNGGVTIRAFGENYQLAKARLLSLGGQTVAEQGYQQRSESYFLKTPDLPQGVYLLQMENQKGEVTTQKIILN